MSIWPADAASQGSTGDLSLTSGLYDTLVPYETMTAVVHGEVGPNGSLGANYRGECRSTSGAACEPGDGHGFRNR